MLYYIKISSADGLDETEGNYYIENIKQKSKQCQCCNFYFFNKMNFRYDKNKCDGCYNCLNYEKSNYQYLFRVIYTKKVLLERLAIILSLKLKGYSKNQT